MTRYLVYLFAALSLFLVTAGIASATKPSFSCANVRCGNGTSCVETPGGPVCQDQTLSCASMLCAQGSICEELPNGPQCVIQGPPSGYYVPTPSPSYPQIPPGYYAPNPPNFQEQSCAYGGYYRYGRLICNPAPSWRQPYQGGYSQYGPPPGYYAPPTYQPRPTRPRPGVPEVIPPTPPSAPVCPMIYAPVCAEKPIVCVKAPCYPIRKTFSNSCMANAEEYTILHKGQCQ